MLLSFDAFGKKITAEIHALVSASDQYLGNSAMSVRSFVRNINEQHVEAGVASKKNWEDFTYNYVALRDVRPRIRLDVRLDEVTRPIFCVLTANGWI